ncbi:MAG: FKBP-type peptidyl-prolyl cis-trans isomerase [Eubacterium sp.]|nr:FKBP-type peptidyl-prolyl cis-trans isomerase [Eubacterium sp.]
MKKENRKMAQERRAKERAAEARKQKAKKVVPIVIVVAAIAVVTIGILATSGLFDKKQDAGDSVASSSGTVTAGSTSEISASSTATAASSASSTATASSASSETSSGASSSSSTATTLDKTAGTVVKAGDTVNIDYTGYLNGEAFDGGSTNGAGTDLKLGSGTYIDGFEDQVEGHKVGETFDIEVTFPEDYGVSDLNGQKVTFTVTINGVYK